MIDNPATGYSEMARHGFPKARNSTGSAVKKAYNGSEVPWRAFWRKARVSQHRLPAISATEREEEKIWVEVES